MAARNLLFLCTDQHTRRALGCQGHSLVKTPNLDRLAAGGVRFANAYTCSPICVPARSALATGRYVHQTGFWGCAQAYDGSIESWAHRVGRAGGKAVAIGKLHYRSPEIPSGFEQQILPMHLPDPTGWPTGLLRGRIAPLKTNVDVAEQIGWGETDYTNYDRSICRAAREWLHNQARSSDDRPWVLFVSFVCPHNPFIAPHEFKDLYPLADVDLPVAGDTPRQARHPAEAAILRAFNHLDYFTDDDQIRTARAAYYGLCSFVDQQIGLVLDALAETGLENDTTILYTSDHGEMLGHLGFWGKYVLYEDSIGVPMIVSGPDIPSDKVADVPVSHVDCFQTVLQATGIAARDEDASLPGHSLIEIARGAQPDRTIVSEYHDGGSTTGSFMVRNGSWKYIHHAGFNPQLFNLDSDPGELNDLSAKPELRDVRAACEARLRTVLDPDEVNTRAFLDQADMIARLGGERAIIERGDYSDEHHYTPVPEMKE